MEVGKDGVDPDDTEHAGAHHNNDGRYDRLAQSAGRGNGAVHKGGDAVGKAHHAHTLHACVDDGALGGEQGKEAAPEEEQAPAQNQADTKGVSQTDEEAFFHAVRLAGTVVLAHKACTGHVERGHAVVDHGVRVGGGAVALDHEGVEGIDACLNEQVRNGKDGVLEPGRQAKPQNAPGQVRVKVQLVDVQHVAVLHPGQGAQDEPGRNALGDGTGQRHAHHAQLAHDDKKQVQQDVQRACNGKVDQRLFGIADGTEHGVAKVVQGQSRHTQKIHPQIQNGTGKQVLFGVQQPQHEGGAQQAHEQQHHAGNQADDGRRVHRLFHIAGMACAVKTGHQHVDAAAQADQEAGEQADKDAGRAHCAQRCRACKPAYHGHVRHVEQHLQQVGECQRQADQKDLLGQRPFGQRFGIRTHTLFFSFILNKTVPAHTGAHLYYMGRCIFCKMTSTFQV